MWPAWEPIQKAKDDTPLRAELGSFLSPVTQYCPTPFSDINHQPQDTLLLAAIWRVSKAEYVRMLREGSEVSRYSTDDLWRMLIPVSEIEESYHYLYGPDAVPPTEASMREARIFPLNTMRKTAAIMFRS